MNKVEMSHCTLYMKYAVTRIRIFLEIISIQNICILLTLQRFLE